MCREAEARHKAALARIHKLQAALRAEQLRADALAAQLGAARVTRNRPSRARPSDAGRCAAHTLWAEARPRPAASPGAWPGLAGSSVSGAGSPCGPQPPSGNGSSRGDRDSSGCGSVPFVFGAGSSDGLCGRGAAAAAGVAAVDSMVPLPTDPEDALLHSLPQQQRQRGLPGHMQAGHDESVCQREAQQVGELAALGLHQRTFRSHSLIISPNLKHHSKPVAVLCAEATGALLTSHSTYTHTAPRQVPRNLLSMRAPPSTPQYKRIRAMPLAPAQRPQGLASLARHRRSRSRGTWTQRFLMGCTQGGGGKGMRMSVARLAAAMRLYRWGRRVCGGHASVCVCCAQACTSVYLDPGGQGGAGGDVLVKGDLLASKRSR